MIIDKLTKNWQTNSLFPDSNYSEASNDDVWVVPDGSELANKIRSLGKRWNPVTNENGDLIDVEWDGTEKPVPPDPIPTPTDSERITALEEENALLKAQINAQSAQMDFYEECIVEMAEVVYA